MNDAFGILELAVTDDHAVVAARRAGREVAQLLGASPHDQIRIATFASEAARHVRRAGGTGAMTFRLGASSSSARALVVDVALPAADDADCARPEGGSLRDLSAALRLMDSHQVDHGADGGCVLRVRKDLPAGEPLSDDALQALSRRVAVGGDSADLQELQRQNRELVETLAALRERQEELTRLTSELEDTNRGVVALYAEIDTHARQIKRADEAKSRFLSSMSHELRTPLASIRALSTLLLSETDGELGEEQSKQVRLIYAATGDLIGIVDDLLDLAKIEAGKVVVRIEPFAVGEFLSALRGMLKPLSADYKVELVFAGVPEDLIVESDEAKVGQILRNFISNALKFTPHGTVTVACRILPDGAIRLGVKDTGIGIPPEQLDLIFEEFTQVESPLQRYVKGTGLGLPLCRRLADLLGARIEVSSVPGQGSEFALILPGTSAVAADSGLSP